MTSEQFVAALLLALPSIIGTVFLGIYTVRKNRQTAQEANKNSAEANDIDRFETFMGAYEKQRVADAERIKSLEDKVDALTDAFTAQGKDLRLIKTSVQRWFARIWAAWPHENGPMPLPSAEELALLEITIPKAPVVP